VREPPFFPVGLGRRQCCPLCREPIIDTDEPVVIPDFLADDADPMWPFTDAHYHRACFLHWDGRKALVARFNALARARDRDVGPCWVLTGDGMLQPRPSPACLPPRLFSRTPLSHYDGGGRDGRPALPWHTSTTAFRASRPG
jgi:hypothetical protein